VHGEQALVSAQRITDALFTDGFESLTEHDLEQLRLDGMDCCGVEPGTGLIAALAEAGVAPSRSQARKLLLGNGIRVNGIVPDDPERTLDFDDALHKRFYMVRRGKKNWYLLVRNSN